MPGQRKSKGGPWGSASVGDTQEAGCWSKEASWGNLTGLFFWGPGKWGEAAYSKKWGENGERFEEAEKKRKGLKP